MKSSIVPMKTETNIIFLLSFFLSDIFAPSVGITAPANSICLLCVLYVYLMYNI